MDDNEKNLRRQHLTQIGVAVGNTTRVMLDANYDCNCPNCRGFVLASAFGSAMDGEDIDDIEVAIRGMVGVMLELRREIRRRAAFAAACEEAGVDLPYPTETRQ